MLNETGEIGHTCLFPDLRRNEDDASCGFFIYSLHHIEVGSLYVHFLENLLS